MVLYDVPDHDSAQLDRWEGGELGLHKKLRLRVHTLDGDVLAWIYVLDAYEGGLPSARYLGVLADAASKPAPPPTTWPSSAAARAASRPDRCVSTRTASCASCRSVVSQASLAFRYNCRLLRFRYRLGEGLPGVAAGAKSGSWRHRRVGQVRADVDDDPPSTPQILRAPRPVLRPVDRMPVVLHRDPQGPGRSRR